MWFTYKSILIGGLSAETITLNILLTFYPYCLMREAMNVLLSFYKDCLCKDVKEVFQDHV